MNASPLCLRPHRLRLNHLSRLLLLGGMGWLGANASALAADRTWSGAAGDSLWDTAGNWNAKPVTTGADRLLFGSAGAGTLENDFTNASFSQIDFLAGAGAYTLQGNAIALGANGFNNESSVTQTVDLDIALTATANRFRAWGGDLIINGVISGTGRVSITSGAPGVVYLNGANTHSGGVTVSNSKVHLGNANALGSGIFIISGTGDSAPTVTFGAGIGTFYTGGLEGSGGPLLLEDEDGEGVTLYLTTGNGNTSRSNAFTGKGGLTIDVGSSGKQVLTGTNTYTGGTLIKSGILELNGASNNITGALTIDGGELSIYRAGTKTVTVSALNGSGGQIVGNTGPSTTTLTLDSTGTDRYAGDIKNGTAALFVFNKQGNGSFTFAGEGTYNGATSVDAGVYRLEGSLTSSLVTVKSGATFEGLGGVIGQSLTLNNDSTLLFELTAGLTEPLLTVGSLTLGTTVDLELVLGGVIAAGTEIQLLDLGSGANRSFATINGEAFPLDGLLTLTYDNQDYLFQYQESATAISLIAVPEPQSVAMVLLGAGAVLGSYWTRRRSGASVARRN